MIIFNSYVKLPEGQYHYFLSEKDIWYSIKFHYEGNIYRKPLYFMGKAMLSGFDFRFNQSSDNKVGVY